MAKQQFCEWKLDQNTGWKHRNATNSGRERSNRAAPTIAESTEIAPIWTKYQTCHDNSVFWHRLHLKIAKEHFQLKQNPIVMATVAPTPTRTTETATKHIQNAPSWLCCCSRTVGAGGTPGGALHPLPPILPWKRQRNEGNLCARGQKSSLQHVDLCEKPIFPT